jgi:hypothetical protein
MNLVREAFLLFSLNLLDALLTIIWVRNGVADEANALMAKLLEMGDVTFLGAKLAIGAFAAFVFIGTGENRYSKCGISITLAVYIGLMGIHFLTGLSAAGLAIALPLEKLFPLVPGLLLLFPA